MEIITKQKISCLLTIEMKATEHRDGSDEVEIWHCEVRTCRKRVHTHKIELLKMANIITRLFMVKQRSKKPGP